MRTGNPALQAFERPQSWADLDAAERRVKSMTIGGTVIATAILTAICAASAVFSWGYVVDPANAGRSMMLGLGGMLGGVVLGLVISFVPRTAPFLSPLYAVAEGVFLAAISHWIAERYLGPGQTGVIFQAIGVTFGILAAMAVAYGAGLVRIGSTAAKVMVVAMGGVLIYALALVLGNGLLGLNLPNLYSSTSGLGIAFTAGMVVLGSLFLVLDFQFIEDGVKQGAPKYMEWYGAFGLLATLVWLYIEVLRLIAKVRSSD